MNKKTTKFLRIVLDFIPIFLAGFAITLILTKIPFSPKKEPLFEFIKKERLYSNIDKILKSKVNLIEKKDRITYTLNSYNRKNKGTLNLTEILEDYTFENIKLIDSVSSKYNTISLLIHDFKREEPFSKLTPEQNKIFKNLKNSISNKNFSLANQNIVFISELVNNLNKENIDLKKDNKNNLILAIASILISIVLGFGTIKRIISKLFTK
jgi:hypothetical protein